MAWNTHGTHVEEDDLVLLVGLSHKRFIIRAAAGGEFQSHRGVVKFDDIIGQQWGTQITSHQGNPFFILPPTIADLLQEIPRTTQILYAKDMGYILVTLGIGPGQHVLEAGTGSGALTSALAYLVGPQGKVTTYEMREEMHRLAKKNLTRFGLADRVDFKLRNIGEGIDERDVDALFLDLPDPYNYLHVARSALKSGGTFGCILPTVNQVVKFLPMLRVHHFTFVDVCEVMLRHYKPDADRFRPVDRMVAHTGFLIFARAIAETPENERLLEEVGELGAGPSTEV